MLQALPIYGNGKIVLREHEAKDSGTEEAPAGSIYLRAASEAVIATSAFITSTLANYPVLTECLEPHLNVRLVPGNQQNRALNQARFRWQLYELIPSASRTLQVSYIVG